MISNKEKKDCCGCGACANICNHKAISMIPDEMGFLYPYVNLKNCINCGLCDNVCSFNDNYINENVENPLFYGVRHKSNNVVKNSRSGGAFIAVSDWILNNGGAVYGVGLDEHFCAVHKRAVTKEERDEFCGSKYVQSNLNDVFKQVKSDLKNGLIVLFTGTPCQTSALWQYIGGRVPDNLYLLDIICHGVPSPAIWMDNIKLIEKVYRGKITNVNFRNKNIYGWSNHVETYNIRNKIIAKWAFTDLFYKHLIIRECCSNCHYANLKRPSDITIGDFWGWEKVCPEFNKDDLGVSLLICNTKKGIELFNKCKGSLDFVLANKEICLQPNLIHPTKLNKAYLSFKEDYANKGYYYVYCKYGIGGWRNKTKKFFYVIYVRIREYKNYILNMLR